MEAKQGHGKLWRHQSKIDMGSTTPSVQASCAQKRLLLGSAFHE